jgi:hypothetical protein
MICSFSMTQLTKLGKRTLKKFIVFLISTALSPIIYIIGDDPMAGNSCQRELIDF